MLKSPWFTLILGLIVGLALGYVLAERQSVPPARVVDPRTAEALPEGHPPMSGADGVEIARRQQLRQQAAELEELLARSPDDVRLLVALGNLHYDAADWTNARVWYERALSVDDSDVNVMTDYGIVLRNLGQFDQALGVLEKAAARDPDHWQALYNQIVILNFDLHEHDRARAAMERLQAMAAQNPQIPDLSELASQVMEKHAEG